MRWTRLDQNALRATGNDGRVWVLRRTRGKRYPWLLTCTHNDRLTEQPIGQVDEQAALEMATFWITATRLVEVTS